MPAAQRQLPKGALSRRRTDPISAASEGAATKSRLQIPDAAEPSMQAYMHLLRAGL